MAATMSLPLRTPPSSTTSIWSPTGAEADLIVYLDQALAALGRGFKSDR
jgi:hypothetical protein